MQRHFREAAFEFPPQKQILHEDRVRARIPHRAGAIEKCVRFAVLHQRIERDVYLRAEQMRKPRDPPKGRQIEILRRVPRGKIFQSEIYGVGPRTEGGARRLFAPCGSKKFRVQ